MGKIQIGCQTYTWQMSGDKYVGQIPHILNTVQAAGFAGFEPEVCMLGQYYNDPGELANALQARNLKLAALCLVLPWAGAGETNEERNEADKVLSYLRHFPGTALVLCQYPGVDRTHLAERQQHALVCVNAVAERAVDAGLECSFHPNSPPGSVFRTAEDYEILLNGLDKKYVGFAPDAGHIANGGMDVLEVFTTYRSTIRHVHFKDFSETGEWAVMGAGIIDFPAIVTMLRDTGYQGWIMVEEESERALTEPDAVTLENGVYAQSQLLPLI